jgi:glycerol kinase
MITGLTRGSTSAHIARAALESIAFQTFDVLLAMKNDSGVDIRELRVDGGATVNNSLMQFQADLLRTHVVRPAITETTALGAAYLAGLATGYWSGIGEMKRQWKTDRIFTPEADAHHIEKLIDGWRKAVSAAINY